MVAEFIGIVEPENAICIPEELWFTRKDGKYGEISQDSFCLSCLDQNHYSKVICCNRPINWRRVKVTYMDKKGNIKTNTKITVKRLNALLENDTFNLTFMSVKQSNDAKYHIDKICFYGDTDDEIRYYYKNGSYIRTYLTQEERNEEIRVVLESISNKFKSEN